LDNIINIYNKLNNLSNKSTIKIFNEIIDKLYFRVDSVQRFLDITILLIKKIAKNQDLFYPCLNKILSDEFKDKMNVTSVDQLVHWLIN